MENIGVKSSKKSAKANPKKLVEGNVVLVTGKGKIGNAKTNLEKVVEGNGLSLDDGNGFSKSNGALDATNDREGLSSITAKGGKRVAGDAEVFPMGGLLAVGGRKHGKGIDVRDTQDANVIAWDGATAVFSRTLQVLVPFGPILASVERGLGAEGERRGAPRRNGDEKGRGAGRSSGSRAASKEAEPRWRRH